MIQRRKYVAAAVVIVLVGGGGLFLLKHPTNSLPSVDHVPSSIPTESSIAKLPPPLEGVTFPTKAMDYPSEWPAEIRYPQTFIVVEARSGFLPGGSKKAWETKLTFNGDTERATTELIAFFTAKGWTVAERSNGMSGGAVVFLERTSQQSSATFVVDSDTTNAGRTKIVATVFL